MNLDSVNYADVFTALGSESRLEAMRLLLAAYPEGLSVGDLQAQLKIPNSTLSHHLEKLRMEELVTMQRDRQFLRYSANVEKIEALLTFLYNGCSVRGIFQTEQADQILDQEPETTPTQESFMFENFFRPVQTFFGTLHPELPGFHRFTKKAIQSIVVAQAESRQLRHRYVGTEQMLMGLLTDETGLVAEFFKAAGVKLESVRQAIERQIGYGRGTPEKIPFTPRAKETLEIALQQAKQLNHSYIGTEHLLLAILMEGQGLGARVLEDLGFDCKALEEHLRSVIVQNSV